MGSIKVKLVPKNIQSYQGSFQQFVDLQPSMNLVEFYEFCRQYIQGFLQQQEWPELSQVACYLQSKPTVKLASSAILQNLQTNNTVDLVIIFPRLKLPLIEVCLNKQQYYYIYEYSKKEFLYKILQSGEPYKSIIKSQKYQEIKINGKIINFPQEKGRQIQGYLQGHSNSIVTIEIKAKQSLGQESKPQYPKQQEEKPAPVKPIKEQQKPKPQQAKKQISPSQPNPSKPKQNQIQLIIKFQSYNGGSTGKQQHVLNADNSSSLLSLLSTILQQLKNKGFDWDENDYQLARDSDKLHIIHENHTFKKIDKPFKSMANGKDIIFTFERHYEGGAL